MDWSTTIRNKAYSRIKNKLQAFIGNRCEMCLEPCHSKEFVCYQCEQDLPQATNSCDRCAVPLTVGNTCGHCLQHDPAFDQSHCNYLYQAPFDRWLHLYKNKNKTDWARNLSRLMLNNPPLNLSTIDAITYVPSSRWSMLKRGFNPAELLATHLSETLELPIIHKLAHRSHSKQQKELGRKQRMANVRSSFRAGSKRLDGQHMLLIDDVMTTGSTAHTLAKILKKAGASKVTVWCLARTPEQRH